jgi:hypothetical protein
MPDRQDHMTLKVGLECAEFSVYFFFQVTNTNSSELQLAKFGSTFEFLNPNPFYFIFLISILEYCFAFNKSFPKFGNLDCELECFRLASAQVKLKA